MKQLLTSFAFLTVLAAHAQVPFSQSLRKGTILDTARYQVTYRLRYKHHPTEKDYMEDTRIVQIGRNFVKDYSEILFHFDSIRTDEERHGASNYSNASGNPWPVEIIYRLHQKEADIKYRLPIATGTLHYSDTVPRLAWNFVSSGSDTIMEQECLQATADFGGRTYTAWFATGLPLPCGPYKFGGLPGLILKISDNEQQFLWEAVGFERVGSPIMTYAYDNEKPCSASEAAKTIERYFRSPYSFLTAGMGGAKIMIKGADGKFRSSPKTEETAIPYKPLERK